MTPFSFPGTYRDSRGEESVLWRVEAQRTSPRFELHTTIRGLRYSGIDFDLLDPDDQGDSNVARLSPGPVSNVLTECVLTGQLPCVVERDGRTSASVVTFALDLHHEARANTAAPENLTLAITVDDTGFTVVDDCFEAGIQRLESLLPAGTRLRCCVTCLYSDYSPTGRGITGMRCHRNAREQYLAVRTKADYWNVPVTEEVLETYVCAEYRRRVPGTGYRG